MKSRQIHEHDGERTFALIFETGDQAMAGIVEFATRNRLAASHFTAIGAFRNAILGYFDWESKEYKKLHVDEQVEVLSLIGDIALNDGKPAVHAHAVLGRSDGTLEVILVESPVHLRKQIMAAFANETGMLPEQVRDRADIPERGLYLGRPTGSAMPLAWAHAEYLKVRRSLQDERVFNTPPQVKRRYVAVKLDQRVAVS